MKYPTVTIIALLLKFSTTAHAQFYHIEPDDFTNGTLLNSVLAQVNLVTADSNNVAIPFNVRATYDGFGFASTGSNVFGHGDGTGVQFWNTDRRLRMDFSSPIQLLGIDFIGGDLFPNDVGELDAFNSSGMMVGSYVTGPLAEGSVETMRVIRPGADIAYALAYVPPNFGSFGRLDNLVFSPVPEPGTVYVAVLGGAIGFLLAYYRRRATSRNFIRSDGA